MIAFVLYLDALQAKVPWNDKIVLPTRPASVHRANQEPSSGSPSASCGHEFGDYRENWKLDAASYVRDTRGGDARSLSDADGAGHQLAGLP